MQATGVATFEPAGADAKWSLLPASLSHDIGSHLESAGSMTQALGTARQQRKGRRASCSEGMHTGRKLPGMLAALAEARPAAQAQSCAAGCKGCLMQGLPADCARPCSPGRLARRNQTKQPPAELCQPAQLPVTAGVALLCSQRSAGCEFSASPARLPTLSYSSQRQPFALFHKCRQRGRALHLRGLAPGTRVSSRKLPQQLGAEQAPTCMCKLT